MLIVTVVVKNLPLMITVKIYKSPGSNFLVRGV